MENIAILTGGDSAEYNISLLSANTVLKNLNKSKYRGFIVHLKDNTFQVLLEGMRIPISKEDFSFTLKGEKIFFSKESKRLEWNFSRVSVQGNYFP